MFDLDNVPRKQAFNKNALDRKDCGKTEEELSSKSSNIILETMNRAEN